MLKRSLKFVMFYLAGLFLLGHNFVPHHHPEEHSQSSHSKQDQHHEPDEDDNPLGSLFSQLQHQPVNKEIKYHVKAFDTVRLKPHTCFVSADCLDFQAIRSISRIDDPPEKIAGHIFSPHPSQISFRGPPVSA